MNVNYSKGNINDSKILMYRNKKTDNSLNDGIMNILLNGSSSSFSDMNYSYKGLYSKRNEKKIYKSNSVKQHSNLNKLNLSNTASKTYNRLYLKYLPKKKLDFPKKESAPLIFNETNKKISLSLTKSLFLIEKGINEKEQIKFKAEYMVKIIKNMDKYLKTKNNYIEYLSDEKKGFVEDYYSSLKMYNNEFIDFLFDDLVKHSNFFLWKKLIIYISERIYNHYKILENYLKELSEIKEQNNILRKKNKLQKYELNNSSNQIEKMNNVIKENQKSMIERDFSKTIYQENLENLKQSENLAKLEIFRLNSEIKDLTSLLNKNKDYYNKYLDLKNKLENSNLYIKELKNQNHQMQIQLNVKTSFFSEFKKEYEEKISALKIQKNQNFENETPQKTNDEDKDKNEIERLSTIKDILTERLNMLNEEMLIWIQKYNEEKKKHNKTKISVLSFQKIMRKNV